MTQIVRSSVLAALVALPALAQEVPEDGEDEGLIGRGMRGLFGELMQEFDPAFEDLQGLSENALPLLRSLQAELGETLSGLSAYEAPEFLDNGDILIRRKPEDGGDPEDALPDPPSDLPEGDTPDPNADGSVDI